MPLSEQSANIRIIQFEFGPTFCQYTQTRHPVTNKSVATENVGGVYLFTRGVPLDKGYCRLTKCSGEAIVLPERQELRRSGARVGWPSGWNSHADSNPEAV